MAFVVAPSAHGTMIERLAHLPTTCRLHNAFRAMEIKAIRFPRETKKFDKPPALALKVAKQRFILNVKATQWQYAMPMCGETVRFANPAPTIGKIVGKRQQAG